jgi:hypothetical protein
MQNFGGWLWRLVDVRRQRHCSLKLLLEGSQAHGYRTQLWATACFVTPYPQDRSITFRRFAQYHDRWDEPTPPWTFHYGI